MIDWELCTLGNPLADVAYMLMIFLPIPGSTYNLSTYVHKRGIQLREILSTTDEPVAGIPDETSLIKSYALQRNLKLPLIDLKYFQALSGYRMASIIQGVYARSVWGNASNEESAKYVLGMVKPLAEAGLAFTRCVCMCTCACACVCMRCVCVCARTCARTCMHVVCVCMCTCVCVCVFVCLSEHMCGIYLEYVYICHNAFSWIVYILCMLLLVFCVAPLSHQHLI